MQRLTDALLYITEDSPQFQGIAKGFAQHLAKSGMPDEFLTEQLVWVRTMIDHVIDPTSTPEFVLAIEEGSAE